MQLNNKHKIKAILFDSGRVLNGPVTGHWFITPNFFTYVDKKKFMNISESEKEVAFEKAGKYIDEHKLIIDESEEYKYFFKYYSIFSECLPQLELTNKKVELITIDYVYNYNKYRFFNDVRTVIPELSKKYKIGVVSDAWPSLENVYKKAGLRDYFSTFIISSKIGVSKPHRLMYMTALNELGVLPEEAVFIDDHIKNCNGALSIGINSIVLCRDWRGYFYNKIFNSSYNIARSLFGVKNILT